MKIAQVAPLYESVPPKYYGGTERVVSYLTEELVRQGHDVTLFASADSETSANLIPCAERSLRLNENCVDRLAHHVRLMEEVLLRRDSFDVIHYHIDYLHYPLSKRQQTPYVTTLHGRLDIPDLVPLYERFRDTPVISISDAQREPLPWLNWHATVHHGLPKDLLRFHQEPGNYLAFLGRVSPEKRLDRAIRIAKGTGMELRIAAKIDSVDKEYFKEIIQPMLEDPLIRWIGEIGETEKQEFLGNAFALVFAIDWPEPFGLVMIEAMACGTPVIAYNNGSVPEIIEDGVNGIIVDDLSEAVHAVERVKQLSRTKCRQIFEERFSVEQMTHKYVEVYKQLIGKGDYATIGKEQILGHSYPY